MSLVSTYVRATDGLFYRNPTLNGNGWFICFDDDDPVEIVVQYTEKYKNKKLLKERALGILKEVGLKHTPLTESGGSMRMFGSKFKDAYAFFFEIENRIDPKYIKEHDGTVKGHVGQGVYYDPLS